MIQKQYQKLNLVSKKIRRSYSYFGFPIQTLYLGFLKHLPHKKRVLDIGCGNGFLIKHLNFWKNNTFAVDASKELVEHLKNENISQVFHHQFGNLEFPIDGKFDWIFCLDVLEHVNDRESFIFSLNTLKTNDNHLVIIFPNQKEHGTEGLILLEEFGGLINKYRLQIAKIEASRWFILAQTFKKIVKILVGFKENDLFHKNPSFEKIRLHKWSFLLTRLFENYFTLYEVFPPTIKFVDDIKKEGIYMLYFGEETINS
ncbi:MAG: hypothetical protein COB02_16340 [Candidatus Cloacimonadota bacterium]|nr:MAG: hypothetical protein COB02_16340 [Candidatus Cloacimonadota bacterium]